MSPIGHAPRKNETAIRSLLATLLLTLAVGVTLHGASEDPQGGQMQAAAADGSPHRARNMKITITIDNRILTGTLNRSKAAQDFALLLPLSLTLEDHASRPGPCR